MLGLPGKQLGAQPLPVTWQAGVGAGGVEAPEWLSAPALSSQLPREPSVQALSTSTLALV